MSELRLAPNWKALPFTEKAAWLCRTYQAANFPEACSLLARRRWKKEKAPLVAAAKKIRLPYADS